MPTHVNEGTGTAEGIRGSQSIHRAVMVLRAIAAGGTEGIQAAEIARTVGLTVATTHRIVAALVDEALVERDLDSRRYRIGPELVALGASFDQRVHLRQRLGPTLRQVARVSGDTAFLHLRSGDFATCIGCEEGDFPIRAMTIGVGTRRPLGVGAGPLAILAFLPKEERDQLLERGADRFAEFGLTARDVEQMADRSVELGYALNDGRILPEMTAIAVPIKTTRGRIVGAVSLAAINSRMTRKRRASLASVLLRAVGRHTPLPE